METRALQFALYIAELKNYGAMVQLMSKDAAEWKHVRQPSKILLMMELLVQLIAHCTA
jgi:hypothetical protein